MAAPSLPPEIIAQILSYVAPESLAPYASINALWQVIVERQTFSVLNITTAGLSDLRHIITPRRYSLVRKIYLKITLAEYSVAERVQVETDEDRSRNNQAFTETICTLFNILSSWSTNGEYEPSIQLIISNVSPSDFTEDSNRSYRRLLGMKQPGMDILYWRYMSSYVELLKPTEELPSVGVISDLVVNRGIGRNIAPATVSKLISRLPRLRILTARLSDNERKDEKLRDRLRNEFAISLVLWPLSLKCLYLDYPGEAPRDADFPPLKRSKPGADAFCITFRQLSQQLKIIHLDGIMVGPELFWPQDDNKQPYWPNLTYFHLTYAASTPSGEWLFERDPRCPEYNFDRNPENLYMRPPMDDAPQDEFPDDYRTAPSPILNRLYIAAAYAARHMPKLETMSLVGQVQAGLNGLLGQNILQCEIKHEFYYEREQGRVSWVGSSEFPLLSEAREAWEITASTHNHSWLIVENIVENDSTRPNIVQNTG